MVSPVEKKMRQLGTTGISLGFVALVICELPVVLPLIGLGTIGASALMPTFWIEVIGITSTVVGFLTLSVLMFRYRRNRHERSVK